MQYAIKMVKTHCATVEQAAAMCGVELAALRAQLAAGTSAAAQVVGSASTSPALRAYVKGAF